LYLCFFALGLIMNYAWVKMHAEHFKGLYVVGVLFLVFFALTAINFDIVLGFRFSFDNLNLAVPTVLHVAFNMYMKRSIEIEKQKVKPLTSPPGMTSEPRRVYREEM
jgi:hypothetical protein